MSDIGKIVMLPTLILLLGEGCTSQAEKTIQSCAESIRNNPQSLIADEALTKIWQVLSGEYPEKDFTRSSTFKDLKRELPKAIVSAKPYLIAFAPKRVFGSGRWSWTTTFWEMAGRPVTLNTMYVWIRSPKGVDYSTRGGENSMTHDESIPAFGTGSYDHWCSGDMSGSSVILTFQYNRMLVISPLKYENVLELQVTSSTTFH